MKKKLIQIVFLLSFIILYQKSFSQDKIILQIDYFDFKYLLENNVDEADSYLSKKNFQFQTISKSDNCDATVWAFKRDIEDSSSIAFISKNCTNANSGFIWFQTGDQRIFDNIREQCKTIGFRYNDSKTNEFDQLCSYYEGIKFKIKFCSGIHPKSNKNVYIITLELNN